MSLTANDFGLQEENINIPRLQGKTTNETGGQKEIERGREGAELYEKRRIKA